MSRPKKKRGPEFVELEPAADRQDFEDALKTVLLAEIPDRPRSENREPTRDELNRRWKLTRRSSP